MVLSLRLDFVLRYLYANGSETNDLVPKLCTEHLSSLALVLLYMYILCCWFRNNVTIFKLRLKKSNKFAIDGYDIHLMKVFKVKYLRFDWNVGLKFMLKNFWNTLINSTVWSMTLVWLIFYMFFSAIDNTFCKRWFK